MKTTTNYALSYPEGTDPADGAGQLADLAGDLDLTKWLARSLRPVVGVVKATSGLAPSPAVWADVPGCVLKLTPPVAATLIVVGIFGHNCNANGAGETKEIYGSVKLDNEPESLVVAYSLRNAGFVAQVGLTRVRQRWHLALTPGVEHTVKLRGKGTAPNGLFSGNAIDADTTLKYKLIAA